MDKITEQTLSEIKADYQKWGEFLNVGIGILSFSLGVACLGTPYPGITGFLSLVFMLALGHHGRNKFPKRLRELRKEKLTGINEIKLIGLEKKYFGFTALIKNFPVFLIGWTFLGGVMIYGLAVRF